MMIQILFVYLMYIVNFCFGQDTLVLVQEPSSLHTTTILAKNYLAASQIWHQEDINNSSEVLLGEFLQRQGVLQLDQAGGVGSYSHISIRGLNLKHTALIIDGVPQTSTSNPQDVLNSIPLSQINKIQIHYLNPSQKSLQTHAGSTIEIFTKKTFQSSLSARIASYGEMLANVQFQTPLGEGRVNASYQGHYALNNYPYWDYNQTRDTRDDYKHDSRKNNYFEQHHAHLSHEHHLSGIPLQQRFHMRTQKQGLAGFGHQVTQDSYFHENILSYFLHAAHQDHQVTASTQYRQDEMYWTARDQIWFSQREDNYWKNEQRTHFLNWMFTHQWMPTWKVEPSIILQSESQQPLQFQGQLMDSIEDYEWNRVIGQIGLSQTFQLSQTQIQIINHWLNYNDFNNSQVSYNQYLTHQIDIQQQLSSNQSITLGHQKMVQQARLQDKYGVGLGLIPNKNLQDEQGYKNYLSWIVNQGGFHSQITTFYTYLKNRIYYRQSYQLAKADNGATLKNPGLDWMVGWDKKINPEWELQLGHQGILQAPRLHGDLQNYQDNLPAGVSPLNLSVNISPQWRSWSIHYNYKYIHDHYMDEANLQLAPSQHWHDMHLRYRSQSYHIQVGVENMTHTQNYQLYQPRPIPGRRFFIQSSYQF